MRLNHSGLLAAALMCASALSATPIGTMSLSSDSSGGVNIQGTRIDFFLPINLPPGAAANGLFATGNPTNIAYSGGVITSAAEPNGFINDLDSNPPTGAANFITFTGAPGFLTFDLTAVGPGGPAQGAILGCAGAGVGVRCSPSIGGGLFSPFVLTYNGVNTDVALSIFMNGRDSTGTAPWKGGFTTQISILPGAAEALLLGGGIVTNTWSFTATSVPEPGTLSVLGSGLMLIGLAAWRKRK